jgi:uncharacterized protein with von Willebrand factor type A (vWA) domain
VIDDRARDDRAPEPFEIWRMTMSKMVLPIELYTAARELCLRLYIANGGNPRDQWEIRPYPGTAAISKRNAQSWEGGVAHWVLCMPALPLDVRLPRWKADLIAAYTVHELLHALWTDWEAVAQSRRDGLHGLVNALEDNRIEARASRGDLTMVSEARKLLAALNDHIVRRVMKDPNFRFDDPAQFSFVLNLVIFAEKLGYPSALPNDWRALVRPEWFPLFELALARFDALASTADCLTLAHDLKALAAKTPKTKTNLPKLPALPQIDGLTMPAPSEPGLEPQQGSMPREPEIVEDTADTPTETHSEPKEALAGESEPTDAPRDEPAPEPALEAQSAEPMADDAENAPNVLEGGEGPGGRGSDELKPEPATDLSDETQTYEEANLNDVAQEAAKEAGASPELVAAEAMHASQIINVRTPKMLDPPTRGNITKAGGYIESPAKLRRHLTLAVKSPERVGVERRHVSGRLDMRNLVGLSIGAENVFRRRVEEEGREAAVSVLLDVSGSMAGARLQAAVAMALHMGDALKAAGVKFEIAGFDDNYLTTPKPFSKQWNPETRRSVAGMRVLNGTAMLPAMKASAERLLKVGNVTRRILLVLTDGQDSYSPRANQALVRFYRSRNVEIVGIGLYTRGLETTFDGRVVTVMDHRKLSTEGLQALVRILDEGAPRVA